LGFKNNQFSRIIKIVDSIWQKFKKDHACWNVLNSIKSELKYLQELALKILAIVPNSVSCKRKFSLLTWLTENKQIQINIQNLETIAKLCTYYNFNAKKELFYFANEMIKNEVLKILNQINIKTFEERLEKEIFDKDELLSFNYLDFKNFSDIKDNDKDLLLDTNKILENIVEQTSQISEHNNYNWYLEDYLNSDNN
ncbi:11357_t:CDS:2, partial [Cetraspora pellucida]